MANLISGKEVSAALSEETSSRVKKLNEKGIQVCLAVIIVGDDPASKVYVSNKKKACEKLGIVSYEYALKKDTDQQQLLDLIDRLNKDSNVNGILCQLPLPDHLDEQAVINAIDPAKDVDCFHPFNVGKLYIGSGVFAPCTPAGVMEMLKFYGIDPQGKNCVVIGRSNIVGKPMSALLTASNGTVTVCHSKTKNLSEYTKRADILVAAVGKPRFVTADMVADGAVVIDVGIHRTEDGKLCGDVDFDPVSAKASYISPVPGGVGPMTIALLMKNTVTAAEMQNKVK